MSPVLNEWQAWSDVITMSFQNLWMGVIGFLPQLIGALIIFIVGWAIAALLGKVVAQIVRAVKVDRALETLGAEEVLSKAGFKLDSGAFVGELVKWFFIIVALVASFDVIGLYQVNEFLKDVVLAYLPQVIVAAIILLAAALIAEAMQKLVVGSAKAADMSHAHFLGGMTRWSIWIFALIIALSHLGIAQYYMQVLFTGVIVMLAIAGGLAFGLGGRDAAERFIEKLRKDISE
jgi:hypothetical protein